MEGTTTIVDCTDTSHAIITLAWRSRYATINDPHCGDESEALRGVERRIDDVLGTRNWVRDVQQDGGHD
jgi:hypothetical protein